MLAAALQAGQPIEAIKMVIHICPGEAATVHSDTGNTSLHVAVKHGCHQKIIEELLKESHFGDPQGNLTSTLQSVQQCANLEGNTPLHLARHQPDLAHLLVQEKGRPSRTQWHRRLSSWSLCKVQN